MQQDLNIFTLPPELFTAITAITGSNIPEQNNPNEPDIHAVPLANPIPGGNIKFPAPKKVEKKSKSNYYPFS